MFCIISPCCLTFQIFCSMEVAWSYNKHETCTNKRQEKLNRIIKNQLNHTGYIIVFIWNPVNFSKFYLWGKDIFAFYY